MARKSTPNKSSPKEKEDPCSSSNPVPQTQKPDYSKAQKNGILKPKMLNIASNTSSSDSSMWQNNYSNVHPTSQMTMYYPQVPQVLPDMSTYESYVDWNTMQNLVYNVPVLPMVVNPLQNIPPISMAPITSGIYGESGQYSSSNYVANTSYAEELNVDHNIHQEINNNILQGYDKDLIDANNIKYLFPPARKLDVDPSAIIDEFCKIEEILEHVPWMLDLEFGIPKAPVPRLIPIYDVQSNSIRCKNTPSAIHPGFEKLTPNFQKILLFHYDCVISKWFTGYMAINKDKSIQDFQTWLNSRMQAVGMCWP